MYKRLEKGRDESEDLQSARTLQIEAKLEFKYGLFHHTFSFAKMSTSSAKTSALVVGQTKLNGKERYAMQKSYSIEVRVSSFKSIKNYYDFLKLKCLVPDDLITKICISNRLNYK